MYLLLTFTVQFALICKWSETIFKRLYAAHSNTAAAVTEAATAFVKADRATVNNSAMLVNSTLLTAALWCHGGKNTIQLLDLKQMNLMLYVCFFIHSN